MFGCDHGEAATRLASYKVPEALSIVDEFPRNALSKLDRSKLQAMAVAVQSAGQMEAQPSQSKQCREPPASRANVRV